MENGSVMYDQREHFVSSEDLQARAKKGELKLKMEFDKFIHSFEASDRLFLNQVMRRYLNAQ